MPPDHPTARLAIARLRGLGWTDKQSASWLFAMAEILGSDEAAIEHAAFGELPYVRQNDTKWHRWVATDTDRRRRDRKVIRPVRRAAKSNTFVVRPVAVRRSSVRSKSRRTTPAVRSSSSSSSDDGPEPPPAEAGLLAALQHVLQDALARVVTAREAIGDGDTEYASFILYDLEVDLAGGLS